MKRYVREEFGKSTSAVRLLHGLSRTIWHLSSATNRDFPQDRQISGPVSYSSFVGDSVPTQHAKDASSSDSPIKEDFTTTNDALNAFEEIDKSFAINYLRTSLH